MMPETDVKLARILTRSMATAQNDDDDDGDIGIRECTDDANVQCDDVSVASRNELIKEQKMIFLYAERGNWQKVVAQVF